MPVVPRQAVPVGSAAQAAVAASRPFSSVIPPLVTVIMNPGELIGEHRAEQFTVEVTLDGAVPVGQIDHLPDVEILRRAPGPAVPSAVGG